MGHNLRRLVLLQHKHRSRLKVRRLLRYFAKRGDTIVFAKLSLSHTSHRAWEAILALGSLDTYSSRAVMKHLNKTISFLSYLGQASLPRWIVRSKVFTPRFAPVVHSLEGIMLAVH